MVISRYEGPCLDILRSLPEQTVHSVVTNPPHQSLIDVWYELLRIMKPGSHLLALADIQTYHRMVVDIEDAGFEIRDQIGWLNETFDVLLWKPIVLARKPLIGTVAENILKHGVGAMNIDACRIEYNMTNKPIPQLANNKREVNSHKTMFDGPSFNKSHTKAVIGGNLSGRWPANVIHDGSTTVLEAFATFGDRTGKGGDISGETAFGQGSGWNSHNNRSTDIIRYDDVGSAARFYYSTKFRMTTTNEGRQDESSYRMKPTEGTVRDYGDVGSVSRYFYNTNNLMHYLYTLITPIGGTILDPFADAMEFEMIDYNAILIKCANG